MDKWTRLMEYVRVRLEKPPYNLPGILDLERRMILDEMARLDREEKEK